MEWRVIPLETHGAFENMALDEACSESVAAGGPPTIRFYRWQPSAVSIGFFQSLKDEVNEEACMQAGVDVVRRRTGGGAVYHDDGGEVTYSVIAPSSLLPSGLTESYREICGWIVRGLDRLGIRAEFKPINDIIAGGKKISGTAQTRRSGIIWQHGTILHDLDVRRMFSFLRVGADKISDKAIASVEERVTRVKNFAPNAGLEDTYKAMLAGFTEGKEWKQGAWTPSETARAEELSVFYASPEWVNLR
ncbi:lipoate--protein ligase family protein [Candidatus Micrarchaeota archaeon]|nr:lipoate--protein ligase family protein [Candidatus Micrarchaeota archaeon]